MAAVTKRSGTCVLRRADLACRRKERRAAADANPSTAGKPGAQGTCVGSSSRRPGTRAHGHTHARSEHRQTRGERGPRPFSLQRDSLLPSPTGGSRSPLLVNRLLLLGHRLQEQQAERAQVGRGHCPGGPAGPLTCPEKGPPKASPSSPLPPGHLGSTSGRHDRSSVVTNGHKRSRYHLVPRLGQIGCV